MRSQIPLPFFFTLNIIFIRKVKIFIKMKLNPPSKLFREGNGSALQRSCLENPVDRGAWWAAVYGVAQSRTRLKRLSSSSSSKLFDNFKKYIYGVSHNS